MVYLTLTGQCQTWVREVALEREGTAQCAEKEKGRERHWNKYEIPYIFSWEKN